MGSFRTHDLSETISTQSSRADLLSWTAVCVQVERADQVDSALSTNLTVTHLEHLGWSHFRPDPLKVLLNH